jgi:hypothetical protein
VITVETKRVSNTESIILEYHNNVLVWESYPVCHREAEAKAESMRKRT